MGTEIQSAKPTAIKLMRGCTVTPTAASTKQMNPSNNKTAIIANKYPREKIDKHGQFGSGPAAH